MVREQKSGCRSGHKANEETQSNHIPQRLTHHSGLAEEERAPARTEYLPFEKQPKQNLARMRPNHLAQHFSSSSCAAQGSSAAGAQASVLCASGFLCFRSLGDRSVERWKDLRVQKNALIGARSQSLRHCYSGREQGTHPYPILINQAAAMLRPASRYVRRRCSSIFSATPASLGPPRPRRPLESSLCRQSSLCSQQRIGALRVVSDRHVAAPSLGSCYVGQQSPPFSLGASQRMMLSTASGGGGETDKESGETAEVETDPKVRQRTAFSVFLEDVIEHP